MTHIAQQLCVSEPMLKCPDAARRAKCTTINQKRASKDVRIKREYTMMKRSREISKSQTITDAFIFHRINYYYTAASITNFADIVASILRTRISIVVYHHWPSMPVAVSIVLFEDLFKGAHTIAGIWLQKSIFKHKKVPSSFNFKKKKKRVKEASLT